MHRTILSFVSAALLFSILAPRGGAQDTTAGRAVYIGMGYHTGGKRKVIVLPMNFPGGDSIRAIVSRDLHFGDRIEILGQNDSLAFPAQGEPNYSFFQQLGAVGVVRGIPALNGITIELHEVAAKRVVYSQLFELPGNRSSRDWRYAVHGAADKVHEWITGDRGIALTRIAFVRSGGLYLIDSDGENEERIEQAMIIQSPSWHPSGTMIAFSSLADASARVHQIGIKPVGRPAPTRWLTTDRSGANITPSFSRSGNELYYAHSNGVSTNIRAVPVSGAGPQRTVTIERSSDNASPSLSPDGRIVFVSGRLGNPHLFWMGIDGGNPRAVVPYNRGSRSWLSDPDWSPNGEHIAFASRGDDGMFQVEIMSVREARPERKTSLGAENTEPSWAPDSDHIVFTSTRTGRAELWILDRITGAARQLTRGGGKNPAWSPHLGGEP